MLPLFLLDESRPYAATSARYLIWDNYVKFNRINY